MDYWIYVVVLGLTGSILMGLTLFFIRREVNHLRSETKRMLEVVVIQLGDIQRQVPRHFPPGTTGNIQENVLDPTDTPSVGIFDRDPLLHPRSPLLADIFEHSLRNSVGRVRLLQSLRQAQVYRHPAYIVECLTVIIGIGERRRLPIETFRHMLQGIHFEAINSEEASVASNVVKEPSGLSQWDHLLRGVDDTSVL